MNRVIVTGGTGFIGRWLVKELVQSNIEVIMLVRERDEEFSSYPLISQVEYSLFKPEDVKQPIDAFFHLAWGGVSTELKNDWDIQLNNIDLSVKMLDLAKELKVSKFIATGTVAEYSFCEDVMDVYAKQTPNDMYGATKTATHYLLETRARLIGMPFIWAVLPSTFGEGRRDKNIITYTITTLLKGEKPSFGYLTQMWDFLYVNDVAKALKLIGEKGHTEKIYGIGSGVYKPLKEYIEIIRDEIDPSLPLGIGDIPSYSNKVFSSCVSIKELTQDTGFLPETTFEEGIRRTIGYFRET